MRAASYNFTTTIANKQALTARLYNWFTVANNITTARTKLPENSSN
jgi:hypothetical protein